MKELPNRQQLFSSKYGSTWIPHLDGKPRSDIGDWLHQNLTWDEFQAIVNPPKSTDELFSEDMKSLNIEYDKNMAILANKYNVAVARDGSSETAKVASARAEIAALDEQYDLDQLAIFDKYYGA